MTSRPRPLESPTKSQTNVLGLALSCDTKVDFFPVNTVLTYRLSEKTTERLNLLAAFRFTVIH